MQRIISSFPSFEGKRLKVIPRAYLLLLVPPYIQAHLDLDYGTILPDYNVLYFPIWIPYLVGTLESIIRYSTLHSYKITPLITPMFPKLVSLHRRLFPLVSKWAASSPPAVSASPQPVTIATPCFLFLLSIFSPFLSFPLPLPLPHPLSPYWNLFSPKNTLH